MKVLIPGNIVRPAVLTLVWLASATAALASAHIFNSSASAGPGETIHLQGDNFGTSPSVYFYLVQGTESSLATPPNPTANLLPASAVLNKSANELTVRLPKNNPMGLYAIWVSPDGGTTYALPPGASSGPVFINRVRSMSFEYFQVSPGYKFRIFGRNLFLSSAPATPVVKFVNAPGTATYSGTGAVVTTYANDGYALQVTAPSNLPTTGSFYVYVSNGYGGTTQNAYNAVASDQTIGGRTGGADPFNLGVPWGADFAALATPGTYTAANGKVVTNPIDVTTAINPHTGQPYNALNTNGDWNNAIQQAIYDAGNPYYFPNGAIVSLPAGTYSLNFANEALKFYGPVGANTQITQTPANQPTNRYELSLPPNVVLQGAGIGQTILSDDSVPYNGYFYLITIGVQQINGVNNPGSNTGVQGFSIVENATATDSYHGGGIRNFSGGSHNMFYDHISVDFPYTYDSSTLQGTCGEFAIQSGGSCYNALVQNCTIAHTTFGNANYYSATSFAYGHDFIFRNNSISSWWRRLEMPYMSNVMFENNHCTRDALFPPAASYTNGGNRTLGQGGPEFSSPDVRVINNIFDTKNVTASTPLAANNDGETICCQALAQDGADGGTVGSPTANTFTDSTKSWPVNYFVGDTISVTVKPAPTAETSPITSNTATVINVSSSWTSPLPSNQYAYQVLNSSGTVIYSGTVTSSTATSITDSHASFTAGLTGTVKVTPPTTQTQTITANSASTLTCTAWNPPLTSTSTYSISFTGYDHGIVASAGSNTMTGTSAGGSGTYWPVVGEAGGTGLTLDSVAIMSGPGMGQWRYIASSPANTSNTLTTTTPWDEPPTGAVYSITYPDCDRMFIKGNQFLGVRRGVCLYTGSHEAAVVNNIFENTGWTIYLRADQRDTLGNWYGRMNLTWNDVITDNVVLDATGYYPSFIAPDFYLQANNTRVGPLSLGNDLRRNILITDMASLNDNEGSGMQEAYCNYDSTSTFSETNQPGLLGTLFDDNETINTTTTNTNYPAYLNSDTYQTSFFNQLNLGKFTLTPLPYSDAKLGTALHASVNTAYNTDPVFLQGNFNGTGTSIGGTSDAMYAGGSSKFQNGSAGMTITVQTSSPFATGTGGYLESTMVASGASPYYTITPTNSRDSWGRIFDFRSATPDYQGEWMVNGAFDFFWRPVTTPATGNAMRALDISNNDGTHGLRMAFHNYATNSLQLEVLAGTNGTGGGGTRITAPFPSTFTAGTIYHLGVTFSTNPNTLVTTAKIYGVVGTGAIDTTSTTNLLTTGTFTLQGSTIYNTSGWLSGGSFYFGDYYPDGAAKTNDYDGFKMYSVDPGTFSALGQ